MADEIIIKYRADISELKTDYETIKKESKEVEKAVGKPIKLDLDTKEIIVDYDTVYTKISADSIGNYFNIYVNGLEPERYYQILIKSIFTNKETIVLDDNYYFKVIR